MGFEKKKERRQISLSFSPSFTFFVAVRRRWRDVRLDDEDDAGGGGYGDITECERREGGGGGGGPKAAGEARRQPGSIEQKAW